MKRIIIPFLLVASLLLSACNKEELEEPVARDFETYVGEIKSLGGIKVNKTITHLFETEDGEILYAFSERYNLSDSEFLNQKTEAYGVVLTYDDLDKPVFEIRRLSEPSETEEESAEVELITYKNDDLGLQFPYQSDWKLEELTDSVRLEAPAPELEESGSGDLESTTSEDLDYIIVARLDASLEKTSDDSLDDRAHEIREYVRSHYDQFVGVESDLSYVGPDQVFAVKYSPIQGDQVYFVARNTELYELGYFHPSDSGENLKNEQHFAELVAGFRFLPVSGEQADDEEEDLVEDEPESVVEEPAAENNSTAQVTVGNYREFESNPYHFKISYPSSWYYSGGSGGYDFSDQPIEDETAVLIRLDLNSSQSVGRTVKGSTVSITVQVDGKFYTLSGDAQYESIMQTMSESLVATEEEEA